MALSWSSPHSIVSQRWLKLTNMHNEVQRSAPNTMLCSHSRAWQTMPIAHNLSHAGEMILQSNERQGRGEDLIWGKQGNFYSQIGQIMLWTFRNMWPDLGKTTLRNFGTNQLVSTIQMRILLSIHWYCWHNHWLFRCKVISYSMHCSIKTLFQDGCILCHNDLTVSLLHTQNEFGNAHAHATIASTPGSWLRGWQWQRNESLVRNAHAWARKWAD